MLQPCEQHSQYNNCLGIKALFQLMHVTQMILMPVLNTISLLIRTISSILWALCYNFKFTPNYAKPSTIRGHCTHATFIGRRQLDVFWGETKSFCPLFLRNLLDLVIFSHIFSEVMQHGASLSPSQLLKILTRGKTNRLSAEPLLDFFNPLKAWLEQQNRNDIIGWNSNMEDVALFKSLNGASTQSHQTILTHFTILTITILLYLF